MSYLAERKRGFVSSIVLLIIAFILLKYFFNLEPKAAIDLVWSYIQKPATFAWDRIIWPLLSLAWKNVQLLIQTGKVPGQPSIPQV